LGEERFRRFRFVVVVPVDFECSETIPGLFLPFSSASLAFLSSFFLASDSILTQVYSQPIKNQKLSKQAVRERKRERGTPLLRSKSSSPFQLFFFATMTSSRFLFSCVALAVLFCGAHAFMPPNSDDGFFRGEKIDGERVLN